MVPGTFIFLMIAIILVCAILVLVILSQDPKGGGLSSTFGGGGSQMFGVQRTNTFLDKSTWTLAAIIAALVILSNVLIPRGTAEASPVDDLDLPAVEETTAPDNNGPALEDNVSQKPETEQPATEK